MDGFTFMDGVYVYFVTFTIVDWLPIFINPEPINIIIDNLRFCIIEKHLRVYAYVIMPNHIHLVAFGANFSNSRLQKTLSEFRRFTGHRLANYVDKNLSESLVKVCSSGALSDRTKQIWQQGWHAEGLASERFLKQKVDYVHENPVRKGYVREPEHWMHSSAGFWFAGIESSIPIAEIIEEEE
jgi:putative transposase